VTDGTASAADYESIIRQATGDAGLSGDDREVVASALTERVRMNISRSRRALDPAQLSSAVTTAVRELAAQQPEGIRTEELSQAHVNAFLDSLCDRIRLPYPLCPADD
jgi:hypothetical protein